MIAALELRCDSCTVWLVSSAIATLLKNDFTYSDRVWFVAWLYGILELSVGLGVVSALFSKGFVFGFPCEKFQCWPSTVNLGGIISVIELQRWELDMLSTLDEKIVDCFSEDKQRYKTLYKRPKTNRHQKFHFSSFQIS